MIFQASKKKNSVPAYGTKTTNDWASPFVISIPSQTLKPQSELQNTKSWLTFGRGRIRVGGWGGGGGGGGGGGVRGWASQQDPMMMMQLIHGSSMLPSTTAACTATWNSFAIRAGFSLRDAAAAFRLLCLQTSLPKNFPFPLGHQAYHSDAGISNCFASKYVPCRQWLRLNCAVSATLATKREQL